MQQHSEIEKHQEFLNPQLIKYLKLKKKVTDIKKEMPFLLVDAIDQKIIKNLIKKLKKGHCLGFTLNDFGKSRTALEWSYTLDAIGEWDGTLEGLQKKICLDASTGEVMVGALFEEALNDLVVTQAHMDHITHNQQQFLVPAMEKNIDDLLRFEVLDKEGQPLFFSSHEVIAGNFSDQDLEKLLPGPDENKASSKQSLWEIGLSGGHSIRVEYLADLKAWRLYDSNDDHTPIPCYFAYTSQAPDNFFLQKKHASYVLHENNLYYYFPQILALVVIPLNEEQVSQLTAIYKNNNEKNTNAALTCAELVAIRQITGHQHYTHGQFFTEKEACVGKILKLLSLYSEREDVQYFVLTQASFASTLSKPFNFQLEARHIKNGGLFGVAWMGEEAWEQILHKARLDIDLANALAEALPKRDEDNWTVLHIIMVQAPSSLPELFNLAQTNVAIANALAKALPKRDEDNGTVLHIIMVQAPSSLPELFKLAQTNSAIANALAKALPKRDEDNGTVLHIMAQDAPSSLLELFKLAQTNSAIANALAKALPKRDEDNGTVLHIMAQDAPSSLLELFKLAQTNSAIANALAKALSKQNEKNWTVLHMMARYAPSSLLEFLNLAQTNVAIANALAQALPLHTKSNWTALHAIAWYAPTALESVLKIVSPIRLLETVVTGNPMFPENTTEKYSCQWLKLHQDMIVFYLKAMKKQGQSTQQEKKSSSFEFENILNELIRKIIAIPTTDSDKFLAEIAHIFALVKSKIEVFPNGSADKTTAPTFFKPVSASMSDLLSALLDKIASELQKNFSPTKNSAIYYEGEIESRKMGLSVRDN